MSSIGIIANPASGKDIRRLVSHATVIDNNEKANIVERIILGAQPFGVDQVFIMPDASMMGYKVLDKLQASEELTATITLLDFSLQDAPSDTLYAAEMMETLGVGCVIVLGGDGTHRLVAKKLQTVPLIGISTGTNNAYPEMLEGTVAGMAAAAVAAGILDPCRSCVRDKLIEIYLNDTFADIALMDAVISDEIFIGAKAIWDLQHIKHIIVSQCHPASIGFSSIVGATCLIDSSDDFGGRLTLGRGPNHFYAPISAGTIIEIQAENLDILPLNQSLCWQADFSGTIAVDGERELRFFQDDQLTFRITRNGPWRVDVKKTLENAQKSGFFLVK